MNVCGIHARKYTHADIHSLHTHTQDCSNVQKFKFATIRQMNPSGALSQNADRIAGFVPSTHRPVCLSLSLSCIHYSIENSDGNGGVWCVCVKYELKAHAKKIHVVADLKYAIRLICVLYTLQYYICARNSTEWQQTFFALIFRVYVLCVCMCYGSNDSNN